MSGEREMSLDEYINSKLEVMPKHHRVQREYREMLGRNAELEVERDYYREQYHDANAICKELQALLNACEPYLKEGETPAECIQRNRDDAAKMTRMYEGARRSSGRRESDE